MPNGKLGAPNEPQEFAEKLDRQLYEAGASMTPFEDWWQTIRAKGDGSGNDAPAVSPREAFEAGYVAAVKAHDASGCPGIFIEQKDRAW